MGTATTHKQAAGRDGLTIGTKANLDQMDILVDELAYLYQQSPYSMSAANAYIYALIVASTVIEYR